MLDSIGLLCVVFTGLEEALLRSTTMQRDNYLFGEMSDAYAEENRRIYSAQAALTMYHELVAIIVSRVAFLLFHGNRFVINLGYNFAEGDVAAPMAIMTIVVSLFIELCFEVGVDAMSLHLEYQHGVDIETFWTMLLMSPVWIPLLMLTQSLIATTIVIWTFASVPNALFCLSSNPCSCLGGGFDQAYARFCVDVVENASDTASNTTTLAELAEQAQTVGLFDFLGNHRDNVLVSVAVLIITVLVFSVAKYANLLTSARSEIQLQEEANAALVVANEKIKEEIIASALTPAQSKIVLENKGNLPLELL